MTWVYVGDTHTLTDENSFRRLCEAAPAHRRVKINKIRFPEDKRACLGVWLLLEYGLRDLGTDPTGLTPVCAPGGKPRFLEAPDIHFNLSHSGQKVMCAISRAEVGCDVEQVREPNLKMAERFFAPEEYAALAACPHREAQRQLFFRLWTLKESFMKAVGLGLALPLKAFSIDLTGETIQVTQQVAPEKTFFFREFDLGNDYRFACCAEQDDFTPIKTVELA